MSKIKNSQEMSKIKNSQFNCSACDFVKYGQFTSRQHPLLDVPVCEYCYEKYHEGEFTVDSEGHEMYCRWCGEGDEDSRLFLCDTCEKTFCSGCVTRNFGPAETNRIEKLKHRWSCYLCSSEPLEDIIRVNGWDRSGIDDKNARNSQRETLDITCGREKYAIPCVNEYNKAERPNNFVYVSNFVPGKGVHFTNNPKLVTCCSCTDNCRNKYTCECQLKMGCRAYDDNKRLITDLKSGIYECNMHCLCNKSRCQNSVVGQGPHLRLEVFRCKEKNKGWGVRCKDDIQPGTFISDYLGEVLMEEDTEKRGLARGDQYLFTLDAFGQTRATELLHASGLTESVLSRPTDVDVEFGQIPETRLVELLGGNEVAKKVANRLLTSTSTSSTSSSVLKSPGSAKSDKRKVSGRGEALGARKSQKVDDTADNSTLLEPSTSAPTSTSTSTAAVLDYLAVQFPSPTLHSRLKTLEYQSNAGDLEARKAKKLLLQQTKLRVDARVRACDNMHVRFADEAQSGEMSYAVDAKWYGNVSRFINHSCDPNLEKRTVFVESHDPHLSRLAFFANSLIPKNTELSYDYGYYKGNVKGKHRKCLCGAETCRGDLY